MVQYPQEQENLMIKYPVSPANFESTLRDVTQEKPGFYGNFISNAFQDGMGGLYAPYHVGKDKVAFNLFNQHGGGRAVVGYKSGIGPSGVMGTDVSDGVTPGPLGPTEAELEPYFYVYVQTVATIGDILGYKTSDFDEVKAILAGKSC